MESEGFFIHLIDDKGVFVETVVVMYLPPSPIINAICLFCSWRSIYTRERFCVLTKILLIVNTFYHYWVRSGVYSTHSSISPSIRGNVLFLNPSRRRWTSGSSLWCPARPIVIPESKTDTRVAALRFSFTWNSITLSGFRPSDKLIGNR